MKLKDKKSLRESAVPPLLRLALSLLYRQGMKRLSLNLMIEAGTVLWLRYSAIASWALAQQRSWQFAAESFQKARAAALSALLVKKLKILTIFIRSVKIVDMMNKSSDVILSGVACVYLFGKSI